ncbi:MAG TPA: hypothetical protein ENJ84_00670 [Gammaproteobacteria bacterium]|nr:hypothetical protein [Gammaproteobacteria bacterium]
MPQFTATKEEIAHSPNTPRAFKHWQSTLPLVNMGETTRQIYLTLRTLNRQPIPCKNRFELMELLRPTASLVLNHLHKHLYGLSFPLSGKSKQIAKLCHALLLELSVGYKHVTHDRSTGKKAPDPRILATSTHRAMRYIAESILLSAIVYQPDPPSSWHDLHRLLDFAAKHHFDQQPIDDNRYKTITSSTIEDVYKQVCLFAMTQPLRLRSGEAKRLCTFFETGCHLVEMKKALTPDDHGRAHVASLKSSEPPAFIPLAEITTFSNLRGFDLTRLISILNDQINDRDDEKAPVMTAAKKITLESQLINRLIHTWTQEEKRRFSRVSTHRNIVATIGLKKIISAINSDVHREMGKEELFPPTTPAPPQPAYSPFNHDGIGLQTDPEFDTRLTGTTPAYDHNLLMGELGYSSPQPPRKPPRSWQDWLVLNTGAGGYGLRWDKDSTCLAQVGELTALRDKEYNVYHWRIGIIRWMKTPEEGGLEVGVQLVAPRAVVVSVETIQNRNHSEILPIEALMLPGMKTIQQPPSLLVPNQFFSVGDVLEINMLGKKLNIELNKRGEHPSFYTQFFYRSTEVQETVKTREEFEDLWSRL